MAVNITLCAPSSAIVEKVKKKLLNDSKKGNPEEEEEDEIFPLNIDFLTPRMQRIAREVLGETEENEVNAMKKLKTLVQNEKNLVPRMDENFLRQFLRARKYNVKKAFKLFQNYYSFRKDFKHHYDENRINPDRLREVVLRNYLGFLPHRDKFGAAVFVAKIAMWDPDVDGYEDLFQTLSGCLVFSNEFSATQVVGYRAIFDLRGMTWKHMKMATPRNLYLIARSMQYCFPGRYRGVHVLTENKFFDIIWATVYPVLSKKLKQRFHFHGRNLSELQKYIDPSVLPEEFGGQAGPFDNTCWKEVLYEQEVVLKSMLKYGYK